MLESIKIEKSHYTTQNINSTFKRITHQDSKQKSKFNIQKIYKYN